MKIKNHGVRRAIYGFTALALAVAALVPGLSGRASAAQVTTRSIKMSSSTAGASALSYQVVFSPGTTTTVGGIVVDFCDNDPIIGDTSCTVPTGFTVSGSPAITANGGMGTGWTAASANSGQVLKLSNTTPQSLSTATPVDFTITTVTNPTTANHSFYARIVTFDTSANMANYTVSGTTRAASFAGMVDYGGIALSTATPINITARVMESLAFCVYKTTCGDDPSMTIGHGTNTILDATAVDTGNAKFSISTNAQSGAAIRWKGDYLKSGANSIPSVGSASGNTTPSTITAGTSAFGLAVTTLGTNISLTGYSTYGGNGTSTFGMYTAGVTGTYGDQIASLTGPTNSSVTTVTFGATASNTTPAGIYTATEQLIATGSF